MKNLESRSISIWEIIDYMLFPAVLAFALVFIIATKIGTKTLLPGELAGAAAMFTAFVGFFRWDIYMETLRNAKAAKIEAMAKAAVAAAEAQKQRQEKAMQEKAEYFWARNFEKVMSYSDDFEEVWL